MNWIIAVFSLSALEAIGQHHAVTLFPINQVQLLESPFLRAQSLNYQYLLTLDADRLLSPFLREAGLPQKAASYPNWESSGLDGHTAGHYLSGLSMLYASTKSKDIGDRLEYLLAELKRCQQALGSGYIGGVPGSAALWREIKAGDIRANSFDLNGKWVPLYNIHKTFAGLRDAYQIAGYEDAKSMLVDMTNWAVDLTEGLSDEQMQDMLRSEHGGLHEVFADVSAWTHDPAHKRLAKRFTQISFLTPLLNQQDQLTGMHANTQIPKVIGIQRIAELEGLESWHESARFFWETVVKHRSVAIGGNSTYEHFHPSDDFSSMVKSVEGPETCNTYNMLKLSAQLFQQTADVRYADYYERALYNHMLSSQHPEHGGLVYFTPMRPAHYRVYSQPETSFWCCVGSGLESHAKYGEFIYGSSEQNLYVNLFIPSVLDWKQKGIRIEQRHQFPNTDTIHLKINTTESKDFALHLRKPSWSKRELVSLFVNGQKQMVEESDNGYLTLERRWQDGDEVQLVLPMQVGVEELPDGSHYVAFQYGPLVLAASAGDAGMTGLLADDSRGGHIAKGPQVPATEIPILVGSKDHLKDAVELISARELRFALQTNSPTGGRQTHELKPFAEIHDTRYLLYWPYATTSTEAEQQSAQANDAYLERLEEQTIDQVRVGQQQPESDHAIRFEKATTGAQNGIQWRQANGWFSYQLRNPSSEAKYLYIRYFSEEKHDFTITVNGVKVADIKSEIVGNAVQDQIIALPPSVASEQEITLRVEANPNSTTAKLTDIRLVKSHPSDGAITNF
ncbi:glycoside hydrolase family 127 protein [Sphingobacterium sp. lm-10]|uniref:glycoside hydrolase family 127 protein n=1 Tax=Sphingobacterium sp. lm-10 TaxID=2944904 RepID=UPI002021A8A8|nr:glycoside hydrolase family 127 protein [Sphingobacterium sp. lm-10]MCL7986698.1 glycoside hydrolase family 127 protein [Sphingobacterium sp. lm-10]